MDQLGNQFSFILFSVSGVLLVFAILRTRHASGGVTAAGTSAALVLALVLFFVLRPGASDVESAAAARAMLTSGKPTMLEFFSNYCTGCLLARPAVDALVTDIRAEYDDDFNILRVDIHTDFGRELRDTIGFSYTPEFVLFDGRGQEIWRSHNPPPADAITQAVDASILPSSG
ncbi:MAG: thioredoxin domain-containing protein [Chloroflexota bacterium]|nr:thioredoxin domain-containing protein [Chloroflexota bacterium]